MIATLNKRIQTSEVNTDSELMRAIGLGDTTGWVLHVVKLVQVVPSYEVALLVPCTI